MKSVDHPAGLKSQDILVTEFILAMLAWVIKWDVSVLPYRRDGRHGSWTIKCWEKMEMYTPTFLIQTDPRHHQSSEPNTRRAIRLYNPRRQRVVRKLKYVTTWNGTRVCLPSEWPGMEGFKFRAHPVKFCSKSGNSSTNVGDRRKNFLAVVHVHIFLSNVFDRTTLSHALIWSRIKWVPTFGYWNSFLLLSTPFDFLKHQKPFSFFGPTFFDTLQPDIYFSDI